MCAIAERALLAKMGAIRDFLAVHRGSGGTPQASGEDLDFGGSVLRAWDVPAGAHPAFSDGTYTILRDGLYAVYVRVSGGDGEAAVAKRPRKRKRVRTHVEFVVRVEEEAGGEAGVELMDVGRESFGEVLHLGKGARVAVMRMEVGAAAEVEFKVELVMRKRKLVLRGVEAEEADLSTKELKKRAKKRRRMERSEQEGAGGGGEGDGRGWGEGAAKEMLKNETAMERKGAEDGGNEEENGDGEEEGESGADWERGFSSDESSGN